jgi:hypothetical protein
MVLMDINASNMSGVICTSQLKENFGVVLILIFFLDSGLL